MNYRHLAQESVQRAKDELDKNSIHNLPYVALELRMALEALIYERAGNFKQELSGKKLNTWQPRKLLMLLLEIDPHVDQNSSISAGIEKEYGKPAKQMNFLGRERVLSLKELKKYYDRLGSYLHTPTLDQIEQGKNPQPKNIKTRCNELIKILEQVLSSSVFNVDFKTMVSITCGQCKTDIVRRLHTDQQDFTANCIQCSASYTVTEISNNQVKWIPRSKAVACLNKSCNGSTEIWENDAILGFHWKCADCSGEHKLSLTISYINR